MLPRQYQHSSVDRIPTLAKNFSGKNASIIIQILRDDEPCGAVTPRPKHTFKTSAPHADNVRAARFSCPLANVRFPLLDQLLEVTAQEKEIEGAFAGVTDYFRNECAVFTGPELHVPGANSVLDVLNLVRSMSVGESSFNPWPAS